MRWLFAFLLIIGSCLVAAEQKTYLQYTAENSDITKPAQQPAPPGYVFDITVQNEKQLDAIFKRADKLKGQFSPDQLGRITMVLHGQELKLFQKSNYESFMEIVDRARQLDQQNLIDIKACQTAMDDLNIEQSELPDFIEQVPLAPVEIQRLQQEKGYTRL